MGVPYVGVEDSLDRAAPRIVFRSLRTPMDWVGCQAVYFCLCGCLATKEGLFCDGESS
jgi:hypothetical protein